VKLSHRAGPFFGWTRPAVVALAALTVVGLGAVAAVRRGRRFVAAPLAAGLLVMLLTPAAWAVSETTNRSLKATLPQAGPRGGAAGATFGSDASGAGLPGDAPEPPAAGLAKFLAAHNTGQRWDLAATNAMSAADLIATYKLSVMALGGFLGSDPAATGSSVASMVEKGEVRYFLTGAGFGRGGGFRRFGGGTATLIMQAVQAVCTPVGTTAADSTAPLPSTFAGQIYDCAGKGPALAARAP